MSRKPQYGLCYASIFSGLLSDDRRIDKLISSQGWCGVSVFMYLMLQAYREYGYFTEWSFADCATTARKMGGGTRATQVQEAIHSCVQLGLFDKGLLETWGILTNTDIQEAYLAIVKVRRLKVFWKPEYWLLAEKPPASSLVSCGQNENNHSDNAHKHSEKGDNHSDNGTVKVKGKSNNSTTTTTSSKLESGANHENSLSSLSSDPLSDEEMEERKQKYGASLGQWEKVTGRPLTPFELEDICGFIDEYGEPWVIEAMKIAGRAGKLNLRYTSSILRNWKTDGREAKKPHAQSEDDIRASFMSNMKGGADDDRY